ncbi:MAG TPA: isochorismatase family protein [Holophaga sp.]|nr:isochorismatase family protein [Holophaga sp.]
MRKALLVIDIQNDYFSGGRFPLWNPEGALAAAEGAVGAARAQGMPVILVQHVADPSRGPAPFFNEGTEGVALHPRILAAAPDAPVVVKRFADSFDGTSLGGLLRDLEVDGLLVCGMMTQNCVTHTVLSKAAEAYAWTVLPDACASVSEAVHLIALSALSRRVPLLPVAEAF